MPTPVKTQQTLSRICLSPKICDIENSLQENLINIRDLKVYIEGLFDEVEKYKSELFSLRYRCESKSCPSSEMLKQDISIKDNIIQLVASALTRLNETKNFSIVDEIFKILFKETTELLPKKENECSEKPKSEKTPVKKAKVKSLSPKKELVVIKKEKSNSLEDVSFKDDSVTEIESTPTRRSPIMHPKKLTSKTISNSPDYGDKKKCPDDWSTPESKAMKLTYINPGKSGSRLRQSKLNVIKSSATAVVDLSTLSELSTRGDKKTEVQKLIKKEPSDNDDTIMPSPTSGPNNFLLTKTTKENIKPKRHLSLKTKGENPVTIVKSENKDITPTDIVDMEQSINSLNSAKLPKPKIISPLKKPEENPNVNGWDNNVSISLLRPIKIEPLETLDCPPKFTRPKTPSPLKPRAIVASPDITVCDIDESMSLLRPVIMQTNPVVANSEILNYPSPKKRPLCENINVNNVLTDICTQASVSILAANVTAVVTDDVGTHEKVLKRKTPEKVEPVYKEPTVRKKAEKKALPAWCCHDCETFFGELYKNDPDRDEKIANTIKNCSKHRGKNNPARPKTPPGFWNPRWEVPQDTEEFNRRNNAV